MSFTTYGQIVNGIICTCKAMCITGCVCGCSACTIVKKQGFTVKVQSPHNDKLLEQTKLPWIKVQGSTNINAYAYAYKDSVLYVQFIGGTIGKYLEVKEEDFNLLKAAESKGKFIANIIKAKYKYEAYVG